MDDQDRLRALEQRVDEIERRLERLDDPPGNFVGDWIEDTEKFAFKLLLQELEMTVPDFSVAEFRRRFLEIGIKTIELLPKASSPHTRPSDLDLLRQVLLKRLDDIIDDLIPPSARD
jgi:hypothetical protein